jgi:hypothetical protein
MSAIHPKADIAERDRHVRFVPKADMRDACLVGRAAEQGAPLIYHVRIATSWQDPPAIFRQIKVKHQARGDGWGKQWALVWEAV